MDTQHLIFVVWRNNNTAGGILFNSQILGDSGEKRDVMKILLSTKSQEPEVSKLESKECLSSHKERSQCPLSHLFSLLRPSLCWVTRIDHIDKSYLL